MAVALVTCLVAAVLAGSAMGNLPPPHASYKILMLLPASPHSHKIVFATLAEGLAERGHEVSPGAGVVLPKLAAVMWCWRSHSFSSKENITAIKDLIHKHTLFSYSLLVVVLLFLACRLRYAVPASPTITFAKFRKRFFFFFFYPLSPSECDMHTPQRWGWDAIIHRHKSSLLKSTVVLTIRSTNLWNINVMIIFLLI